MFPPLLDKSLIPLGGKIGLRVAGRPYFGARGQMPRQLEDLAAHCVTLWQRRLQRPLHASPTANFLSGFDPQPDGWGGGGGLRPYHRAPWGPQCPPVREVREEGDQAERGANTEASGCQQQVSGWARGTGPQAGCAPFMGRPPASAVGQWVKAPVALGCRYGHVGHPRATRRPRVGGRTSRG